jgi:DNA-binding MarR family transcriptional regulator
VATQIFDHPVLQVFSEIHFIHDGVRDAIAESLPPELTVPQYEVLRLLDVRGDGLTPAEISEAVYATKSSLTVTLQRLEAADFIRVEPCAEDGRKKRVWLTQAGAGVYSRAVAAIRPKMDHLREAFTLDEFRAALPFLKALHAWFKERDWA